MRKELTDSERKSLQLEMLDELHKVCTENGLRYSLAYGTLLGAIRHKGFIPWDDDVDIMMPYEDMIRFKELLRSKNISYLDLTINKDFLWFFSRIVSNNTYSLGGRYAKEYGVSIDLYPVVHIVDDQEAIERFLNKGNNLADKVNKMIYYRQLLRLLIPVKTVPGLRGITNNLRNHVLQYSHQNTSTYFSTGGSFKMFNIFKKDIFERIEEIQFEGRYFNAVSCFDTYLSQIYGNYMELPPEDQRVPYHNGQFYWID